MNPSPRPTVVIACRVMQELLGTMLPADMKVTYQDILLHNTPKKLAAALQASIDAEPQPSTIIVGYGLCGNGLVGVKSGAHTLVIPRTHDCVAIFLGFGQSGGGFDSLPAVRQLFSNDWALLAGWVHYLAFDLFVGAWVARDAARSGVSRWFLMPVLPLTFLFGPAGFLLFQIFKAAFGKGMHS